MICRILFELLASKLTFIVILEIVLHWICFSLLCVVQTESSLLIGMLIIFIVIMRQTTVSVKSF